MLAQEVEDGFWGAIGAVSDTVQCAKPHIQGCIPISGMAKIHKLAQRKSLYMATIPSAMLSVHCPSGLGWRDPRVEVPLTKITMQS